VKEDLRAISQTLMGRLFNAVKMNGASVEKISENELVMKGNHIYLFPSYRCISDFYSAIMRSLIICRDDVQPYVMDVLSPLSNIIDIISKNPINPKFNHFTFESIGSLIKYIFCFEKSGRALIFGTFI
jgi:exportin-2 (importin alpha re-exporter)